MRTTRNNGTFCEIDRLFLERIELEEIVARWGTPLFLYDEKGLRESAKSLFSLFSGMPGTKFYFPVHMCPKREILEILAAEHVGAVCLTPRQLRLAVDSGIAGEDILYGAVTLPQDVAALLRELDVTLLASSPLALQWDVPRRVDLAISIPPTMKVGFTSACYHRDPIGLSEKEILKEAPRLAAAGVELGLAIIEGRNTTAENYFANKLKAICRRADQFAEETGVEFSRLNLGEGPGMTYNRTKPGMDAERSVSLAADAAAGRKENISVSMGYRLIDPAAFFVTAVLGGMERTRPTYVVDASFCQVSIPGIERYRHVSVLGKEWLEGRSAADVVGCRALTGDWFAERRILPKMEAGDLVVFHDMGSAAVPGMETTCVLRRENGQTVRLEHGEE